MIVRLIPGRNTHHSIETSSLSDKTVLVSNSIEDRLPESPLVVIEPSKSWSKLNIGEIWVYHELLYFLVWRDLKVRYKQTILGVAWVIMQPLLATIIFTVFLGILARVPSDGAPYPLFVYAGLLPWLFFSNAILGSGTSLISNAHLITKVYFPRMIIPAAAIGARLVDFCIAFTMLIVLMIYYRVPLTLNITMLPLLILITTLMALGCGMLLSAVNVKYRDVGVAMPVLIQLWMFVSPILYPSSMVPEKWRLLYTLNPFVGIVDNFRVALFGGTFKWFALGVSALFTILVMTYSMFEFKRVEKSIADII